MGWDASESGAMQYDFDEYESASFQLADGTGHDRGCKDVKQELGDGLRLDVASPSLWEW